RTATEQVSFCFSSRRRHTRLVNDWSSDVCSSDLEIIQRVLRAAGVHSHEDIDEIIMVGGSSRIPVLAERLTALLGKAPRLVEPRSEERRVGKEGRSRGWRWE